MTLCVYRNNTMYSDIKVTTGNHSITNNSNKTFKIYRNSITKELTLHPAHDEYAIISCSGYIENIPRFLNWFINNDHDSFPMSYLDIPLGEDYNTYLVMFKNKLRLYKDFKSGCYIEFPLTETVCIGSGATEAHTLLTYNPNINIEDVFQTVSKVNYTVGDSFNTITFND